MPDDAITLITRDHREMEQLFEQLQSGPGNAPALVEQVAAMLLAHSRAEEEHVYPAIVQAAPEEEGEVHHGKEEHEQAEQILRRLQAAAPGSEEFTARLAELVEAVQHHVQEEESEVLPALREAVGDQRLQDLGKAFRQRRQQELERRGQGGAGRQGRSGHQQGRDEPTRAELYEQAKEQDVPGRSKMNKDELAEVVDGES